MLGESQRLERPILQGANGDLDKVQRRAVDIEQHYVVSKDCDCTFLRVVFHEFGRRSLEVDKRLVVEAHKRHAHLSFAAVKAAVVHLDRENARGEGRIAGGDIFFGIDVCYVLQHRVVVGDGRHARKSEDRVVYPC